VVDLPGTYSLSSYSPEERIAQTALAEANDEAFDVVVVVADATNLKRGLAILPQVLQLGLNPVLCLNMADEALAAGQQLDLPLLQQLLGFPVVETAGHRGVGVTALREAITRAAQQPAGEPRLVLGEPLTSALRQLTPALVRGGYDSGKASFVATRLLQGDQSHITEARRHGVAEVVTQASQLARKLEHDSGRDIATIVTQAYFAFVDGLLREVVRRPARADARALSDLLDHILVHRFLGLPIFAAVMYGIFWLTFKVGEVPMNLIERGVTALGEAIGKLWPQGSDSALASLLVDGVVSGVGGVVVFLPNILLLFFGLAVLEDTGYLSRAAFLTDRLMHRFGLHGKSFIPLVTGFGCSIPGIMATRTLENDKDRLTTMLVLPLVSCGARLPIWLLLVPAFFSPTWRAPALFLIYTFGIVLALLLALLLRRTLFAGDEAPFVMELPPYRLPTARAVVTKMLERGAAYLKKAATLILGISIVMWFITTYPKPTQYQVDADLAAGRLALASASVPADDDTPTITERELSHRRAAEALRASWAGKLGLALEPALRPLGLDWRLGVAMIGAFAAKEVFVAQLSIVYALGRAPADDDNEVSVLRGALARDFSPAAGLAAMLFLLIATPCMATFAVTARESGHWKWAVLQFVGLTALGYVIALVAYQLGRWVL
jgi:ferrous iron transport protein B